MSSAQRKIEVSPSLLAADFSDLAGEVRKIENAGADYLHLDVMDGHFVPNISFGAPVISCLRPLTKIRFDVHLMIEHPLQYIKDFASAGADLISFHIECQDDPDEVINLIRSYGIAPAIAVSPDTPADSIFKLLPLVDMVLVMTVYPGYGGQSLIPETLDKVRTISAYMHEHGISVPIEVDGGIKPSNAKEAIAAGATVLVAGTAVFKSETPASVIADLKKA